MQIVHLDTHTHSDNPKLSRKDVLLDFLVVYSYKCTIRLDYTEIILDKWYKLVCKSKLKC